MSFLFHGATSFNGDLSGWDVGNVQRMGTMFSGATSFNGDLSRWDVSSVTDMRRMFINATSFNGDLGNWDVSNVNDMREMLDGTALSTMNYDNLLTVWSTQQLQQNVVLGAEGIYACNALEARQYIIDTFNWTINDNFLDPACINFEGQPFITI